MKFRSVLTAGGVLLLILAGSLLLPRSKEAPLSREISRAIEATPQVAKSRDTGSVARPNADADPDVEEVKLRDEELAAVLNTIEQASVTYDSKALPLIEPYLLHPDPQVRMAALNGMIVLGEAAAGPLLRKAAERSPTPKEAVALADAADFVELPSGTFVPKDRTAAGTRTPHEGDPGARSRHRLARPADAKETPSSPVE